MKTTTTRLRRRDSIARDVPVEYARAPIAVIVVAHMGANAVFLPNAKSADRADIMDARQINSNRSSRWRCDDVVGRVGEGGTHGEGRNDRSRLEVDIHRTQNDRDVHKKIKHGTWRDDVCMRDHDHHTHAETVM